MRRRDSLRNSDVAVDADTGARTIVVPASFIQAVPIAPEDGGHWHYRILPDGRWLLAISEEDLIEACLVTCEQIRTQTGKVSDRRYEILRALTTRDEWADVERQEKMSAELLAS